MVLKSTSPKDQEDLSAKGLLEKMQLGSSVAEFDNALANYFVETGPFRALTNDTADIIAGDKGTGKTALFKILCNRYRGIKALKNIEVVPGFNDRGNPVFQRLAQDPVLSEGQYTSLWKAYIFSLVANWLIEIVGASTESLKKLDNLLESSGLKSADSAPATIFSRLVNSIRNIRSLEASFTFSESGIPIVTPKIAFGGNEKRTENVPHEEALRLLDDCLRETAITVWVVLDRLDEAFQGFSNIETPALRALFRTYLDLLEFQHIRLKLFVRKDLFRKIIAGGFVNLTHINARKVEIIWEEEDLLNLLCRRLKEDKSFMIAMGLTEASNQQIFDAIFPEQVDSGERKASSWNWIMSRIRDGNNVKPPRNLIDLVTKARDAQLRNEDREPRQYFSGDELIQAEAIKRGLTQLSSDRVEDTLLAEAGNAIPLIEKFRNAKSEHNAETIAKTLGISITDLNPAIHALTEIGFLEQIGENYKIPMLYRDGLNISQGKAFQI